jgi:hypothetical protein
MKVFSLYHHNKFVASFPTREDAIEFGKSNGGDPWDYDVIVEYLHKSPLTYNPLTNPGPSIPFTQPPVITKHPDIYPLPDIYGRGVKVNYSDGPQGDIGISDYGLNGVQQ